MRSLSHQATEIIPHSKWEALVKEQKIQFMVFHGLSDAIQPILGLRSEAFKCNTAISPDMFDEYSEHYAVYQNQCLVAALRVTRRTAGPMECEEYVPCGLLQTFHNEIATATRFVAAPQIQGNTTIPQMLLEVAWLDQIQRGTRLEINNVHERAIGYYGRIGSELVADTYFVHPQWKTPSHVMLYPATPNRNTPIQHVFLGMACPLELSSITDCVELISWQDFRRKRTARQRT